MTPPRRAETNDQPLSRRKMLDRAFILPMLGAAFLFPPIAGIFELDVRIAGIPFTVIYLFTVWGLLILGAALLAKPLADDELTEPDPGAAPADDE